MDRDVVKYVFSVWTIIVLIGLYIPFIIMSILSLSGPQGSMVFPVKDPGFFWYKYIFGMDVQGLADPIAENYGGSLVRSVIIALIVTVLSTVLAMTAAQAFRSKFRGSGPIFFLFLLGIITPGVTVGLGQAFTYEFALDISRHWLTTVLISHLTYTFPYCFLVLLVFFNRFDRSVEEAAASLGASSWHIYRTVTLPIITPGILASCLFAFTLSFDEFARTSFVQGVKTTVPLMILGAQTNAMRPTIYVAGTLTTVFSTAVIVVILVMLKIRLARTKLDPGERLQEEEA